MKRSELKQLIKEVIQEVNGQSASDVEADKLNIRFKVTMFSNHKYEYEMEILKVEKTSDETVFDFKIGNKQTGKMTIFNRQRRGETGELEFDGGGFKDIGTDGKFWAQHRDGKVFENSSYSNIRFDRNVAAAIAKIANVDVDGFALI